MNENNGAKKEVLITVYGEFQPGETWPQFIKRVQETIQEKTGFTVVVSGVPLEE